MKKILYLLLALSFALTACEEDHNDAYLLQREDIIIMAPEAGFFAEVGKPFELQVKSVSDEGVSYAWFLGTTPIANTKNLVYTFKSAGQYTIKLLVSQGDIHYNYNIVVEVTGKEQPQEHHSPYIAKVLDYRPAVGQYVNELPQYVEGDTQEDMNRKAFEAIGKNNQGLITLGGFGGYVILGFDHTIENKSSKQDFRIMGNAFEGNSEPGIVMVAVDANKNGIADDKWYEIAGSAHLDHTKEVWYESAQKAGNDIHLYRNYQITYHRPEAEPKDKKDFANYIAWEDNQGNIGFKQKNTYHEQPYFPQWIKDDQLTFEGTCLPQNFIDESGEGTYFVGHKFGFGYADNDLNETIGATFDIDWAVDANGKKVNLKGIDFIKIYTGVNQDNGWIGECSTEISGAEDLHILGENIESPTY